MAEKLNIKDKRLITVCILLSMVSLFITQSYFKQAFPEASINMDITNEEAKSKAEGFLANRGIDVGEFMHAKRFGYEREAKTFLEWWASLEAVPVINRLRSGLEAIRKEELQKALSRMGPDFSARERKVVEALSKGIINKILHTPVTNLRAPQPSAQRKEAIKLVESLFNLGVSDNDP